MASSTSTPLLHPLSTAENDVVARSVSQMPGCDLEATARATILNAQMHRSGALALLRQVPSNTSVVMLLDTTEGEPLWFQHLSPKCRLRCAHSSSHHYSLDAIESDETTEIIFHNDVEEDTLIGFTDIAKCSRRLTRRDDNGECFDADANCEHVSSPKEIEAPLEGSIRGVHRTNEGVSAPCRNDWNPVSASENTNLKQRRNTVPIIQGTMKHASNNPSSRVEGRIQVENWLEQMPFSSPMISSAPLRTNDQASTKDSTAINQIFDCNASSHPGALSPVGAGSWQTRFPTLRRRRRRSWKSIIGGKTFEVPDVTNELREIGIPKDDGGFGTIRQGELHGEKVAVKQIKLRSSNNFERKVTMKDSKRYQREVIVAMRCATLEHRNIIKFKGVAIAEALGACLVFPWMENGNSLQYVRTNPGVSRLRLIHGTLRGLEFLHRKGIIHNDVKAYNVLISNEEIPVISDFGLATSEDVENEQTSLSIQRAGNVRWKAPELIKEECAQRTRESDMWAFGMFSIEILTGELPFPLEASTPVITVAVTSNRLPERPSHPECSDGLWELIQRCWEKDPANRISAKRALRKLDKLGGSGGSQLLSEDESAE